MESLDRPYGDDEVEYRTVQPELNSEVDDSTDVPEGMPPTSDLDDRAHDPAFQAVIEGGGGVSEGFEIAAGELIENAQNAPQAGLTAEPAAAREEPAPLDPPASAEAPPAQSPPPPDEPPAEKAPAVEAPPAEEPPPADEPPAEKAPAVEAPPAQSPPPPDEPPAEKAPA